jgi:hypothetical protein
VLFCAVSGALAAEDKSDRRALGMLNGKAWKEFPVAMKVGHLLEFSDPGIEGLDNSKLTFGEIARGVD